jgi:hypothetical protein
MTTDRELLELAAKAAGIEVFFDDDGDCYRVKASENRAYWNPLQFDGDALRLAVKLRINLHVCESDAMTTAYADGGIQGAAVDFMDDAYAATRRAIVCAAAEIGKAMP